MEVGRAAMQGGSRATLDDLMTIRPIGLQVVNAP
jgi:hypothetical protein